MALNYPPIGYTGENVEGSNQAQTKPGIVRAATAAEAGAGTRNDVFISPATIPGFSSPVTVAGGGTGDTTLTNHGVMLGQGTSAVVVTSAGTNGQVLTGSTGADPSFGAIGIRSGLTAHGVVIAENASAFAATAAGTNGQVLLGSTGADPAFGTLTTSTGVGFTLGAVALAVNLKQGGYKINAASTGVALVAQNSYTVTQAGLTSFVLPVTAAVGDMFVIASGLGNTAGWIITQNANQQIWSGTSKSTSGVTGTLAGAIHTSVMLMCTIADLEFIVLGNTTGYTFV